MENDTATRKRGRPRSFDKETVAGRAAHLFWERGYEGVSVDELTAAMGITPQSLYAAFGSKEALHREALAWYDREVTGRIRQALTSETEVAQAVRGALRVAAREFTKPGRPAGCMRSIAGLCAATGNEAIARQGSDVRRDTRASIRSRLERGIDEGQLDGHADAEALALYINAVVVGMAIAARDGAAEGELRALADVAVFVLPIRRNGDRGYA